ncbi:MAG: L-rhamnose isomerase [Spirochaetota bacterium]
MNEQSIKRDYDAAREAYDSLGVDTEAALARMADIAISIHCRQGDDVTGFEHGGPLTGGIIATGNFPGKARTPDELRADFEKAYSLIPGTHRLNLHAIYLDTGGNHVDRDEMEPSHFRGWIDWARDLGIALDFNPTFFSHPKSDSGFTLAHRDKGIRDFWIEHGRRSRVISAEMGRKLGTPSVDNFWIPDGWKDQPADRLVHREILVESLDAVFAEELDPGHTLDAVESKLFGIASESYVVGSHEFYLAYAQSRNIMLCMDAGHYHPTESIAEKVSALLPFFPRLLLHVSRPVRWDSDHVVLFDDDTRAIMREITRANAWDRVYVALDFFDASINRIEAWVIGTRSAQKAALFSLLEPISLVKKAEQNGRLGDRLALQEEAKTLPFGAVWNEFCRRQEVPAATDWLSDVAAYERDVLSRRGRA